MIMELYYVVRVKLTQPAFAECKCLAGPFKNYTDAMDSDEWENNRDDVNVIIATQDLEVKQ